VAEYWRAIGLAYPKDYIERHGADLFAVKASAEFHASARYDELIDVGCRAGRVGRSSVQFLLGIWRGEEHLTSGELVYVNTDLQTQRSKPWPGSFTSAILSFERTPPDTHPGAAR
jgi:acyl-CoA thioester hydrolase